MNRIPFHLKDQGLSEIRGIVYVEDRFLVLRVRTSLLGLVDTDSDELRLDPQALAEVRHKRGLLRDRLMIKPVRVELLDALPGDHLDYVVLKVWRKYRRKLAQLLDEFEAVVDAEDRRQRSAGLD